MSAGIPVRLSVWEECRPINKRKRHPPSRNLCYNSIMAKTQPITVACKLEVSNTIAKEIDETLLVFASACDWVNQNTPNKMTNKTAMQSLVYHDARVNFGLSANLAIQAIRRVCANRKTAKQKGRKVKEFSPTSISYDARKFSFREKDWTVSGDFS